MKRRVWGGIFGALAVLGLALAGFGAPALAVEFYQQFSQPSAAGPPPEALLPFLPKDLPSGSHLNLDFVEVPPEAPSRGTGLLVASYEYRDKERFPHSRILVVGLDPATGGAELLWQSEEEDVYMPVVILERGLKYQGSPIVLVSRHQGAAWTQIDVIGFSDHQSRLLYTRDANWFEMARLSPGSRPQLLAYMRLDGGPLCLPEVLEWTGEKFVEASHKYPTYFDELARKGKKEGAYSYEIALLMALAGHRSEALLQLDEILREEPKLGEVDKRIEYTENFLKSSPGPYLVKDFQREMAIWGLSESLERNPKDAQSYAYRGSAYLEKGQDDLAMADFNKALQINPKYTEAYYRRAKAYFKSKEYNKAWEDVRQAQKLGGKVDPEFLQELRRASGREK